MALPKPRHKLVRLKIRNRLWFAGVATEMLASDGPGQPVYREGWAVNALIPIRGRNLTLRAELVKP